MEGRPFINDLSIYPSKKASHPCLLSLLNISLISFPVFSQVVAWFEFHACIHGRKTRKPSGLLKVRIDMVGQPLDLEALYGSLRLYGRLVDISFSGGKDVRNS